ncbi:hypothetical protein J6590_097407, partial [Homalodisca vitripennis]
MSCMTVPWQCDRYEILSLDTMCCQSTLRIDVTVTLIDLYKPPLVMDCCSYHTIHCLYIRPIFPDR